MEINWGITIWISVGLFLILAISIGGFYEVRDILNTRYKMPNGIICNSSTITGGGFGGATHEFYRCSDRKRYVNPETYRKYRIKNKLSISDVLLGDKE